MKTEKQEEQEEEEQESQKGQIKFSHVSTPLKIAIVMGWLNFAYAIAIVVILLVTFVFMNIQ